MKKRPRRTPAEKARAQYTNYAVKEPMELMEFLAAKMPCKSHEIKIVVKQAGRVC